MPTTFVKGDLFEDAKTPDLYGLAFGADCAGTMDQGIAVAFKKRWPTLADAYEAHSANGGMHLGDVFAWKAGNEAVIFVLGVQLGEKWSKVSTLTRAFEAMIAKATADNVAQIALPRIGTGKSGIDPMRVKRVLTELGEKTTIRLVVFEQFVRGRAQESSTE